MLSKMNGAQNALYDWLLDEKRKIAIKETLTETERARLDVLNELLRKFDDGPSGSSDGIEKLQAAVDAAQQDCADVERQIRTAVVGLITAFGGNPTQNYDKFKKANAVLQELGKQYGHTASVWSRKYDNWRKGFNRTLREQVKHTTRLP